MSNDFRDLIKNFIILAAALVLSYLAAISVGDFYEKLFPSYGSIFVADLRSLFGFPLAYIFFLALLFTAFGGQKKYWWIGILLIPAAAFEVYFDLPHIYFPIALGLLGWGLGLFIQKVLLKHSGK